jgi:hypothetical protein
MHHAWDIAQGAQPPTDDPHHTGIVWNHGDAASTRAAAERMRDAFHMAYPAVTRSRHMTGDAIDMTIQWTGDLRIRNASGLEITIDTLPRHGGLRNPDGTRSEGNAQLHEVGAGYRVYKLKSDPPHWSSDGH